MSGSSAIGENANINAMPTEILLHIFSFLPVETTAFLLREVCARWQKISTHPSLYRDLYISEKPSTRQIIFILINLAKHLNSLTLKNRKDANVFFKTLSINNVMIKSLKVINSNIRSTVSFSNMLQVATKCKELQVLRLKNTLINRGTEFFESLVNIRQLTSFQPGFELNRSMNDVVTLITANISEQRLEHLRLFHRILLPFQAMSHESLLKLVDKYKGSLKTLKIDCRELNNDSVAAIIECKQLSSLGLKYFHRLNDEGISRLGDLKLTRLSISSNSSVTGYGWTSLFLRDNMSGLVKLTLVECKHIDCLVLKSIGESLKELKLLRIIRSEGFTDDAFLMIKESLPSFYAFHRSNQIILMKKFSSPLKISEFHRYVRLQ